MRTKTIRLDDLTRDILLRSVIEANRLTLPEQLDRPDYNRVAKAIEAAGGQWNRKERCHVFPKDVKACMGIDAETVEIVNHQQTYQTFYTPTPIANEVARLAQIDSGCRILEPSVGTGQLARAAVRYGAFWSSITGIDIDRKAIENQELQDCGFRNLVCADFLKCKPGVNPFDRILMNPPFSMGDDIKHVQHALNFLRPGGRLVSIVLDGPKQRKAFPYQQQLNRERGMGEWIELPPDTFKESGTSVNTAIIIIDKDEA